MECHTRSVVALGEAMELPAGVAAVAPEVEGT